jgi:hypothetical protein
VDLALLGVALLLLDHVRALGSAVLGGLEQRARARVPATVALGVAGSEAVPASDDAVNGAVLFVADASFLQGGAGVATVGSVGDDGASALVGAGAAALGAGRPGTEVRDLAVYGRLGGGSGGCGSGCGSGDVEPPDVKARIVGESTGIDFSEFVGGGETLDLVELIVTVGVAAVGVAAKIAVLGGSGEGVTVTSAADVEHLAATKGEATVITVEFLDELNSAVDVVTVDERGLDARIVKGLDAHELPATSRLGGGIVNAEIVLGGGGKAHVEARVVVGTAASLGSEGDGRDVLHLVELVLGISVAGLWVACKCASVSSGELEAEPGVSGVVEFVAALQGNAAVATLESLEHRKTTVALVVLSELSFVSDEIGGAHELPAAMGSPLSIGHAKLDRLVHRDFGINLLVAVVYENAGIVISFAGDGFAELARFGQLRSLVKLVVCFSVTKIGVATKSAVLRGRELVVVRRALDGELLTTLESETTVFSFERGDGGKTLVGVVMIHKLILVLLKIHERDELPPTGGHFLMVVDTEGHVAATAFFAAG